MANEQKAKGYTTKEEVENYILTEISEVFNDQIDSWIAVAEQIIDRATGRNFIADSTASVRYFDGNGGAYRSFPTSNPERIYIDECLDIEEIKVYDENGTELYELVQDTDFVVEPYNELPIRALRIKPTSSKHFTKGLGNIKITATWGYSAEAPEPIKFVATVLTGGIINFSNNASGEVKSESIGGYSVTYRDNQQADYDRAMEILNSYKKLDV